MNARNQVVEAELRLKLAAQSAALSKLSALGEMASGIAHEVNTPLAAILTRAQSLERTLSKRPPAEVEAELAKIVRTTQRIAKNGWMAC